MNYLQKDVKGQYRLVVQTAHSVEFQLIDSQCDRPAMAAQDGLQLLSQIDWMKTSDDMDRKDGQCLVEEICLTVVSPRLL